MFTRICTTAALLLANSLIALPAKADVLPNLYAKYYCEARAIGVPQPEARRLALHEATISTKDAIKINVFGLKATSDTYLAVMAALKRCPNLIN